MGRAGVLGKSLHLYPPWGLVLCRRGAGGGRRLGAEGAPWWPEAPRPCRCAPGGGLSPRSRPQAGAGGRFCRGFVCVCGGAEPQSPGVVSLGAGAAGCTVTWGALTTGPSLLCTGGAPQGGAGTPWGRVPWLTPGSRCFRGQEWMQCRHFCRKLDGRGWPEVAGGTSRGPVSGSEARVPERGQRCGGHEGAG